MPLFADKGYTPYPLADILSVLNTFFYVVPYVSLCIAVGEYNVQSDYPAPQYSQLSLTRCNAYCVIVAHTELDMGPTTINIIEFYCMEEGT